MDLGPFNDCLVTYSETILQASFGGPTSLLDASDMAKLARKWKDYVREPETVSLSRERHGVSGSLTVFGEHVHLQLRQIRRDDSSVADRLSRMILTNLQLTFLASFAGDIASTARK